MQSRNLATTQSITHTSTCQRALIFIFEICTFGFWCIADSWRRCTSKDLFFSLKLARKVTKIPGSALDPKGRHIYNDGLWWGRNQTKHPPYSDLESNWNEWNWRAQKDRLEYRSLISSSRKQSSKRIASPQNKDRILLGGSRGLHPSSICCAICLWSQYIELIHWLAIV